MDPASHPLAGRSRTWRFRDDVVAYLRRSGFRTAYAATTRVDRARGDILGLPMALVARRQQTLDLSGTDDMAASLAAVADRSLYASVLYRKSHPVEDAYAVMPLRVLVHLLGAAAPLAHRGGSGPASEGEGNPAGGRGLRLSERLREADS